MGKIVFWLLILQLSLLSAVQDKSTEVNISNNNNSYLNDTKDNASSKKKISFLNHDKFDIYLALTFGLNTCFLSSSTDDYETYGNKDSFNKVLYGENIGFSWILNNAESSSYNKWFLEHEAGVYYSEEMSDTKSYKVLKASKSVPYIQFAESSRAVYEINQNMFLSLGFGFYFGRGISKEFRGDSFNLFYLSSYRINNIELELIYKCRLIDWDSLFIHGITMGEYTDIAYTTNQVLKLNLKMRY